MNTFCYSLTCFTLLILASFQPAALAGDLEFSRWNTRAPYAYLIGKTRSWPVSIGDRKETDQIRLLAKIDDVVLAEGNPLSFDGFQISLTEANELVIKTKKDVDARVFSLDLIYVSNGATRLTQTLRIQPAPPDRPISYLADLIDDFIGFFRDLKTGKIGPIVKPGLDQYFRRLQAHGVKRLIVWQSTFPFSSKPEDFTEPIRSDYVSLSHEAINNPEILQGLSEHKKMTSWRWRQLTMQLTTTSEFGEMFSRSAQEHGISLTASFRPFESALQKYYTMPIFDENGQFLKTSHYCSYPPFDADKAKHGFAHYREILKAIGMEDHATVATIEFQNVPNRDQRLEELTTGSITMEVKASQFPPIDPEAFVFVKSASGKYKLTKYAQIQEKTFAKQLSVPCREFQSGENNRIRLIDLKIPVEYRYVTIRVMASGKNSLSISTDDPVRIFATAGNSLGKFNSYWVITDPKKDTVGTRVAPLQRDGSFRSQFNAVRNSENHFLQQPETTSFAENHLVIDRGDAHTDEMLNFENPATRAVALKQIRDILSYPAFDEILINTRSHTQFAGSWGDGKLGIRPTLVYRRKKIKGYRQLGLDLGYVPLSITKNQDFLDAVKNNPEALHEITHHVSGDWDGTCQSPIRPNQWRFVRNQSVARGLRLFFEDLRAAHPSIRIRAVLPPSAKVEKNVKFAISKMTKNGQETYNPNYFRYLCTYLNYIPAIGEGMAMVDLNGLNIEPMILGYRGLPDQQPRRFYLKEFVADLRARHDHKGPYSFFYEAQETMRMKPEHKGQERREAIIKELIDNSHDIKEVILYEAADWINYLPYHDEIHGQHGYLD